MRSRFLRTGASTALLCLLAGFLFVHETRGEDLLGRSRVLAFGRVKIAGQNVAAARKAAISEALKKGVEYHLAGSLEEKAIERNFSRIVEDVMPGAQEAVLNFNVLSEDRVGDQYVVLLGVKINKAVINHRLKRAGIFLEKVPPLKVLIMVSQRNQGEARYWWGTPENPPSLSATEVAFHNVLERMGFIPINRSMGIPVGGSLELATSRELEKGEVVRWGQVYSADAVIHGETRIEGDADKGSVALRIEAFDVGEGRRIFRDREEGAIEAHGERRTLSVEAVERAVRKVSGELGDALIKSAAGRAGKISRLEVALGNVESFQRFKLFRDFLVQEVKGVRSVRQSRIKAETLTIMVEFDGDRDTFRDRVEGHDVLPFPVRFDKTSEGDMLIQLDVQ